jgi:hypothetical protein
VAEVSSWLSSYWAALVTAVTTPVDHLTFWASSWTAEEVTAAGTVALAFLTLILGVGTIFLWLATRRLVRGSEKTAEHQLRAYVFPEKAVIAFTHRGPEIAITFRNCGQTPANDIVLYSTTIAAVYPLLEEPKALTTPPDEIGGNLGPGMSFYYEALPDPPITNDELASVRAGTKALYIFGAISYINAFEKKHCVNFCYFRGGPNDIVRDGPMALYNKWNEAS